MTRLLNRLGWFLGRVWAWFKRRPCVTGLLALVASAALVTYGFAFFAPDKIRNLGKKLVGHIEFATQLLPATLPSESKIDKAYWLTQNWTARDRYWFHHTSQGTTTFPIPFDWFLALERPELSVKPGYLSDQKYLSRLGFIPSPDPETFKSGAAAYGYHGEGPPPVRDVSERDRVTGFLERLSSRDRYALPVGFAKLEKGIDPTTGKEYPAQLGLTCAACHTGHIEYNNVSLRFDGGPAMVNLGELERAVGLAIGYTMILGSRFNRFADKVAEISGNPVDKDDLRTRMEAVLEEVKQLRDSEGGILKLAQVGHADEGFGRLDALNRIGNQVFYRNMARGEVLPSHRLAANFSRYDAPVSFPPLWGTPYFLWAQYDASVFNELVRNAGEALGVNAKVNMTAHSEAQPLFKSSVKMHNLYWFEEMLRGPEQREGEPFKGLSAPKWSEAAGKFPGDAAWTIDEKKAAEGRVLYDKHCMECHRTPMSDPGFWSKENRDLITFGAQRFLNVVQKTAIEIGTDPQQARVLSERRVNLPASFNLNPIRHLNEKGGCDLLKDETPNALDRTLSVPFVLALMAVVDKTIDQWFKDNAVSDDLKKKMVGVRPNCQNPRVFRNVQSADLEDKKTESTLIIPHYRARPLDGVWATAPYLHNGSVPTLYDMLRPQDERPKTFCVGSRAFDPRHVGLVKKADEDACAPGLTDLNVSLLGNSNRGHSFQGPEIPSKRYPAGVIGPELTEEQRWQLIEYLKTL